MKKITLNGEKYTAVQVHFNITNLINVTIFFKNIFEEYCTVTPTKDHTYKFNSMEIGMQTIPCGTECYNDLRKDQVKFEIKENSWLVIHNYSYAIMTNTAFKNKQFEECLFKTISQDCQKKKG